MPKIDVKSMSFQKTYGLLVNKLQRKGHKAVELDQLIQWMCGYTTEELDHLKSSDISYGQLFSDAPRMNPLRFNVKGKVCGVTIESIDDPLMKDIRILDKLVDDLSKGKSIKHLLEDGSTG